MALLSFFPRNMQKRMHKRVQEADGKVKSLMQESLESLLVIHAYGCKEKITNLSEEKMTEHRRERRRRSHVFNIFGTGLRICMQGGYLFGFIWCGLGIIDGTVTYGTLTAMIQLIGQIQAPFANIGSTIPKYASMLASAERLMEFSTTAKETKKTDRMWTRNEAYEKLKSISFEGVSFAYDADRPVLLKLGRDVELIK